MIDNSYPFTVTERFLRYVVIDTQSDPNSASFPSTAKQKDLSSLLLTELQALGLEASMDDCGYVMATIPANSNKKVPVICFCSHVDTAPDCSGTHVKPILHRNYAGTPIVLPDDAAQVLTVEDFPYLRKKIGDDIITASGHTLLGADDKAGLAIIMDMAAYLQQHPEVKHGTIRILFTPDEETGRGTEKLNMQALGADYGYTLDGGEVGDLEDETFSADGVGITFHGISAHPGYAKGKLVNALKVAAAFVDALPKDGWSPERTDGREGFVHPVQVKGIAEQATVDFIIRDFDTAQLAGHENWLRKFCDEAVAKFPGARYDFVVKEQYRNMKDVLDKHPQVVAYAHDAITRAGLAVRKMPIRGGTDGSRLSYMGLPCPNIFTGMQGIHSKREWISVQDMQKAVQSLVHLCAIWEENA